MLDLNKSYGQFEGISFYGDHEQETLIYYFPDEVQLAEVTQSEHTKAYDLHLQIFKDDLRVVDTLEDVADNSGAILSLGVECKVAPKRLEKASRKLANKLGLDHTTLRFTVPLWKEGKVDLIILDATTQTQDTNNTIKTDSMVDAIIGSKVPSLVGGHLKSIFNVRLDQKGANLIGAAIMGERDQRHIAGIIYSLKYEALQPALDLRIRADLARCKETVGHIFSADVGYPPYVGVGADLEFIKSKLEENGSIQAEVISLANDEKTRQQIRETVNQFKDKIIEKLFEPVILPQDVLGKMLEKFGGEPMSGTIVQLGYKYRDTTEIQNRVIEVDYRERLSVVRPFNPQANLWALSTDLDLKNHVQIIDINHLWRDIEVEVSILHDFVNLTSEADLISAEVLVWRKKDGLNLNAPTGRFALPDRANYLAAFAFSAANFTPQILRWTIERDEPTGYYYQVRFLYNQGNSGIDSVAEVLSLPQFSNSQNLTIIPSILAPSQLYEIKSGGSLDFNHLKGVDINLRARDKTNKIVATEHLTLNEINKDFKYKIRRAPSDQVIVEAAHFYHFKDNQPSFKRPFTELAEREIIINNPLEQHQVKLLPIVINPDKEQLLQLLFEVSYKPTQVAYNYQEIFVGSAPNFSLPNQITIKTLNQQDEVNWKASVITKSGELQVIEAGKAKGTAPVILNLSKDKERTLLLHWVGTAPDDHQLKYLKLDFKLMVDGKKKVVKDLKFSGSTVPEMTTYLYPPEGDLELRIIRRYKNGKLKKEKFRRITEKDLIIQP